MSASSEARTLQFTRLLSRTWGVPSWQWLHIHTWYYHCFRHVRSRINQFFPPHSHMCNIMFLYRLRFKFWLHRLQNWAYFVSFLPFQTYNSSVIQGILSACPWGVGAGVVLYGSQETVYCCGLRSGARHAKHAFSSWSSRPGTIITLAHASFFFLRWVKT